MNKQSPPRRMRNTKIIATLGPASTDAATIHALFDAGADVFRLNFSHGSHADHQTRYLAIRALEEKLQRPIAVLLDLQGPKPRGVNVPGVVRPLSALTAKDREDLAFGLALGVDWIALSFVQRPEDVLELKRIVGGRAAVMAKLEEPSAIEALDAVIAAADGLMVTRGDLGVELPPEEVPGLQKRIIRACRAAGKPVVVATQMLESMVAAPAPTRAEAGDVATAVCDGADAVMLSAESASGAYPVEAVTMMDRIIVCSERDPLQRKITHAVHPPKDGSATDAICAAIRTVADILPLTATVAYTTSGATTLRIAQERLNAPILSLTSNEHIARRLALVWGVHSICADDAENIEDMVGKATAMAAAQGFSLPGRPLVVVAGTPFGIPGSTNLLRVVWPDDTGHDQCQTEAAENAPIRYRPRDAYFSDSLSEAE